MRRLFALITALVAVCGIWSTQLHSAPPAATAERPKQGDAAPAKGTAAPPAPIRTSREEKALQDARRQQLAEKESMLAAKEQELKKLSGKLDAQLKAIEDSRKRLEEVQKTKVSAQKKAQEEKMLKMVKFFKTLKGEQAGKYLDNLPEPQALALLSRLDTKTVAKLAPSINQPRVLKWISDNISETGE